MQLSNERMRHTAEGAEVIDSGGDTLYGEGEEGGMARQIHRDLATAKEREEYALVRN